MKQERYARKECGWITVRAQTSLARLPRKCSLTQTSGIVQEWRRGLLIGLTPHPINCFDHTQKTSRKCSIVGLDPIHPNSNLSHHKCNSLLHHGSHKLEHLYCDTLWCGKHDDPLPILIEQGGIILDQTQMQGRTKHSSVPQNRLAALSLLFLRLHLLL